MTFTKGPMTKENHWLASGMRVHRVVALGITISILLAIFDSGNSYSQDKSPGAAEAALGVVAENPDSQHAVKIESGWMVPYQQRIPGTDVEFWMVPVPGGEFLMGSPATEEGRSPNEGPQVRIRVAPLWVGRYEVTRAEYEQYCQLYSVFKEIERNTKAFKNFDRSRVDVVTAPTEIYDPTFVHEYTPTIKHPAVTMTKFAAQQYTKWLSAIAGVQYRLPTEAEWEYACRSNSQSVYSWGNDSALAGEHCWFFENQPANHSSDFSVSIGGRKSPNGFGIYDMEGNVMEWTVDSYAKDWYQQLFDRQRKLGKPLGVLECVNWPSKSSTGVVRGGNCDSYVAELRCAARQASDHEEWQEGDAGAPPSPWWYSSHSTQMVGFRVVRSSQKLPPDTIRKFWDGANDDVKWAIDRRLEGGRGAVGVVDDEVRRRIGKNTRRKQ